MQWDLKDVKVVGFEGQELGESVLKEQSLWTVLSKGGPLAAISENIFPAMVQHYQSELPVAVIADFFATAALDAGEFLGVPTFGFFPNPSGMTSLLSPHLRGWLDIPHVWFCLFTEGVLARLLCLGRNRERAQREAMYRLPPLLEQDIYPSLSMQKPILASSAIGFEYAFPHSHLLQYTGPSPPCNEKTRDLRTSAPELSEWMMQQEAVMYVAFGTQHSFNKESVNVLYEQLKRVTSGCNKFQAHRVSVLWSLPSCQQELLHTTSTDHMTNNIRLETFVPQWDVLASPKTVVFVTHCGANSLYEALLTGTPVVCCPGKADQPANAARVVSANVGVLSKRGVYSVEAALLEVLTAVDMFTENACKIRDIFKRQGGASTGADFVEKIMESGTRHLTLPYETCGRYSWTTWCGVIIAAAVAALSTAVHHQ